MLSAVQIKPDVYWVGALDWNAREFHGYTTEAGITYNAYLILEEGHAHRHRQDHVQRRAPRAHLLGDRPLQD